MYEIRRMHIATIRFGLKNRLAEAGRLFLPTVRMHIFFIGVKFYIKRIKEVF